MKSSIIYKEYVIEVNETKADYRFTVKKDDKIILESSNGYPFPSEAEVEAKLYINRISPVDSGWRIS